VRPHISKLSCALLTILSAGVLTGLATGPWHSAPAPQAAVPALDPAVYHHVAQITWVVADVDQVADYWQRLGIHDMHRLGVVKYPNLRYRGKPDPATTRQVTAQIGALQVRWIQPLQGGGFWQTGFKAHGDGIRVLGYSARSPQEFDNQLRYFSSKGVGVVVENSWQGTAGEGRFAYLDTAASGGGHTIALIDDPDARSHPVSAATGNQYPLTKITHFAWVVDDVRKVDAYFTGLGFQPFSRIDHNVSLDRVYREQPGSYEMWLGWDRTGEFPFEWVQQITGPDVYLEYRKAHGEGFHHLGVNVTDMDAAIRLMQARGAPPSQLAAWNTPKGKGRAVYLDTEPYGGETGRPSTDRYFGSQTRRLRAGWQLEIAWEPLEPQVLVSKAQSALQELLRRARECLGDATF
jgi:hypothetical protein